MLNQPWLASGPIGGLIPQTRDEDSRDDDDEADDDVQEVVNKASLNQPRSDSSGDILQIR